ncbi:MAG: PTS sugar transporter subunit IIA [Spirochaetales bacterium]|nr:PTS sugar transporter subunit IIA [Spirochaetales bacterium]
MSDDSNIMTLRQMADYLKIARRSLLKMAQRGDIPATKVASQWRFMRTVVDDWLISQMKTLPQPELERLIRSDRLPIPLPRLLPAELVRLDIRGRSKEHILHQLCEPLVAAGLLRDPGRLVEMLVEREEMVSTAIFPGIAIPHPRRPEECPVPEPRLVLGISRDGVDFDSLDGKPTYVLFLVCANQVSVHLKLIAELTLLFRQGELVTALRGARTAAEALQTLFDPQPRGTAARLGD